MFAGTFRIGEFSKSFSELGIRDTVRILFRHFFRVPVLNQRFLYDASLAYEVLQYFDGYLLQNADARRGLLGFGLLHHALIVNMKPARILCIGSKKGFIPALCAMACRDVGRGHVDFVDAGYSESDANGTKHWGGIGFWRSQNPQVHFSFLGLDTHITTHVMTTDEYFRKTRKSYEYIYIDGDHTYEGVKKDFNNAWPRLKKGGLMLLHDTDVRVIKEQLPYGVWKLWRTIPIQTKVKLSVAAGLGIIQKVKEL